MNNFNQIQLLSYYGNNPLIKDIKNRYIKAIVERMPSQTENPLHYYIFDNPNTIYLSSKKTMDLLKYNYESRPSKERYKQRKFYYTNYITDDRFYVISDETTFSDFNKFNEYLLRNFAYTGKKFNREIELTVSGENCTYVPKQFGRDGISVEKIKVDGIIGETSKVYHFTYGSKNFYVYKNGCENVYVKLFRTVDIDEDYLNSLNVSETWIKNGYKFYPHQIDGIKFLLYNKKACIFDSVGIGKSNQALVASILNGSKKTLIITIKDDVFKWQQLVHDFGKTAYIVQATMKKDDQSLDSSDYHIMNYDIIKKFSGKTKNIIEVFNIFKHRYETIIVDECHRIRNADAKRSNIIKRLFTQHYVKNVYALSATPFETNEQLWGLYYTLGIPIGNILPTPSDGFETQVQKFNHYKLRYCNGSYMQRFVNNQMKTIITVGKKVDNVMVVNSNTEELYQCIKGTYLCRTPDDVDGFPKKEVHVMDLTLPIQNQREYDDYVNELLNHYSEMDINPELPIVIKLRQFLSMVAVKQTAMFARNLIADGEKVIIFTHFKEEFSDICKELADVAVWVNAEKALAYKKMQNKDIVELFKSSDKYKVLIGNAQTLGTGHNIPQATHVIINSPNWNSGEHSQMMGRNWRLDRKETVHAWFWIYNDTKCEHVFKKAQSKSDNIKILLRNLDE